jgi:hypothetical protein
LSSQRRRLLGRVSVTLAVAAGAGYAIPVSPARAGLINLAACNPSAVSQPFARWGDPAPYELAPGGDFETPGWTLNGSARRVPGSEPYAATGTLGSWSLALPAGSSAQSPTTCVDAAYPTVRFFIAGTGAVAASIVDGSLDIPAGVAVAGSNWLPTPVMVTSSAVLAATSNGVAEVSVRITALSGDPRVDDVFIDPWNRR